MTEFNKTLVRLGGMVSGWQTICLRGREWKHGPRLMQAFEREFADARHGSTSRRGYVRIQKIGTSNSRNADPEPEDGEAEWRLWVERPDRIRAEFGTVEDWITAVFRGDTWWSWAPLRGARTRTNGDRHHVGHGKGPGWALVDTATIPAVLSLSVIGSGRFLDRETIRVRGIPKLIPGDDRLAFLRHQLLDLGLGADEYMLTVDRATGVLLRSEAVLGGQPFQVVEAVDFAVDEVLPAETFVLSLPAGVAFEEVPDPQVRPPQRSRLLRLLGR